MLLQGTNKLRHLFLKTCAGWCCMNSFTHTDGFKWLTNSSENWGIKGIVWKTAGMWAHVSMHAGCMSCVCLECPNATAPLMLAGHMRSWPLTQIKTRWKTRSEICASPYFAISYFDHLLNLQVSLWSFTLTIFWRSSWLCASLSHWLLRTTSRQRSGTIKVWIQDCAWLS